MHASSEPPNHADTAIQNHLDEMRRQQHSINPPTWVYREIADFYHLPFDPRERRRHEDLMKWLNEFWPLISTEFFHMLDNHPDRSGKKKSINSPPSRIELSDRRPIERQIEVTIHRQKVVADTEYREAHFRALTIGSQENPPGELV
jgi:hypothetical protein